VSSQDRTENGTGVTHDPLCVDVYTQVIPTPAERCVACSVIAKVREDERRQSASDYADGERDMLAKCIAAVEACGHWYCDEQWAGSQHIQMAEAVAALQALQEKP
jgi:hypothetical protein